jgi:hypothetical protein
MKKIITGTIIGAAVFCFSAPQASAQITLTTNVPGLQLTQLPLSGYIKNTQAAPIISVATTTIKETSTLITWKTDKRSRSKLYYDTKPLVVQEALGPEYEPMVMSGMVLKLPAMATSSAAEVFHLSPGTTYYYFIQSTDSLGNVTITPQLTFRTQ